MSEDMKFDSASRTEQPCWRWPMLSRKAHWYPDGIRSACNGWMLGRITETQTASLDKAGPDDCARCWRAWRKTQPVTESAP